MRTTVKSGRENVAVVTVRTAPRVFFQQHLRSLEVRCGSSADCLRRIVLIFRVDTTANSCSCHGQRCMPLHVSPAVQMNALEILSTVRATYGRPVGGYERVWRGEAALPPVSLVISLRSIGSSCLDSLNRRTTLCAAQHPRWSSFLAKIGESGNKAAAGERLPNNALPPHTDGADDARPHTSGGALD